MQTYKIVLRQGGHVQHIMSLNGVTAAEVIVLRKLHGANSVTGIEVDGDADLLNEEVRLYLNKKFGPTRIEEIFGDPLVTLPEVLNDTVMSGVGRGSEAALEAAVQKKRAAQKTVKTRKKRKDPPVIDSTVEPATEAPLEAPVS